MRSRLNVPRFPIFLVAVSLSLATLACGPIAGLLNPSPTPIPATTVSPVTATATLSPSPTPTSTQTATPTSVPATSTPASAHCPAPASPDFPRPADFEDYPDAIQAFLSAGGSVETLRSRLREWSALSEEQDQVVAADVNGDGPDEVIISIIDPQGQQIAPPGVLLVFECSEGAYTRLYREGGRNSETFDPSTRLVGVRDITQDGLPDVVYVLRTCGAHTCYERLRVLGWDGSELADLLGGTLDLPYPTYEVEPARIEAISGGIGSVGAEPQRRHTEIWTWNGTVFTRTEMICEPAVYRYHVLLDGDRALQSGDYGAAIEAYRRVLNDNALKEWGGESGMMTPAEERAQLSAFARWRLILTYLLAGRGQDAQLAYDTLQQEYPSGAGQDVVQMASVFWTTYQGDAAIPEACAAVVADVDSYRSILEFYNRNYGYANPNWEPKDLCPF